MQYTVEREPDTSRVEEGESSALHEQAGADSHTSSRAALGALFAAASLAACGGGGEPPRIRSPGDGGILRRRPPHRALCRR